MRHGALKEMQPLLGILLKEKGRGGLVLNFSSSHCLVSQSISLAEFTLKSKEKRPGKCYLLWDRYYRVTVWSPRASHWLNLHWSQSVKGLGSVTARQRSVVEQFIYSTNFLFLGFSLNIISWNTFLDVTIVSSCGPLITFINFYYWCLFNYYFLS